MEIDPFYQKPRHKTPPPKHPQVTTAAGRKYAAFPVWVLAFVVDHADRYLLLRRQGQPGWEVLNGALEPGESIPEALAREVRGKLGTEFRAVYLGVLDTFTFVFDANLPPALMVCTLLRFRGGDVRPTGDLRDATAKWWDPMEVDQIDLAVPRARWDLLTKAVDMARYLRDARPDSGLPGAAVAEDDDDGYGYRDQRDREERGGGRSTW